MKGKVLYLFNSGFAGGYKESLVNLLSLPVGSVAQMRYTPGRNTGDFQNCSKLKGMKAIIIFNDRYAVGRYNFYPFRIAKVVSADVKDARFTVVLKLGEYCTCDMGINAYDIIHSVYADAPSLQAGGPDVKSDGKYAFLADSIEDKLSFGGDSWLSTVKALSELKQFSGVDGLFVRFERADERSSVFVKSVLRVTYYFKDFEDHKCQLRFSCKDPVSLPKKTVFSCETFSDSFLVEFLFSGDFSNTESVIDVYVDCKEDNVFSVRRNGGNICIDVEARRREAWVVLCACIIAYSVAAGLSAGKLDFCSLLAEFVKIVSVVVVGIVWGKRLGLK